MKTRSGEKLRDTEDHLRQVVDAVPDGLFLLEVAGDGSFHILEINSAFETIASVTRAQCRGMLIDEIIAPQLAAQINSAGRCCIASGASTDGQFELEQTSERHVYQLTLIPLRDVCGHTHRITGITRDITQAQRLEAALHARAEEFHALVDNAPDCISRYDTEGRILFNNPAHTAPGRDRHRRSAWQNFA